MDFVTLYSTELNRELGSSKTDLFTTVLRKAAINTAQLEWNKRTHCYTRQTTIALVDGTQEYDLETIADFGGIAAQGVSIRKTDSNANVTYLEGDDLTETTVERLNVEEPGWRAASAGTPRTLYRRGDGGAQYLGLHPAPDIPSGDTWVVLLPYWAIPADMSADADEPFTVSANTIKSLRPYHRALAHWAAHDLEKLRKDTARSAAQMQLFEAYVEEYNDAQKPKRGTRVRFVKDYRGSARTGNVPRRWNYRT